MHEIEVKLKFKNKAEVIRELERLGAKFREKYELEDTYFSLEHGDMKNIHNLIRVRKKKGQSELTFKGKCETKSDIWKRLELSTSIGDSETMVKILKNLNFNKILENRSVRE